MNHKPLYKIVSRNNERGLSQKTCLPLEKHEKTQVMTLIMTYITFKEKHVLIFLYSQTPYGLPKMPKKDTWAPKNEPS